MGYERNGVIQESFQTRRAEGVLKKEKGTEKHKKVSNDFIEDKLHFIKNKKVAYAESVNSGKLDQQNIAIEKLHKIRDRRNQKEHLKEQMLQQKDQGVNMLKEIHELREANVRNNAMKNQQRFRKYKEDLALKLQIQKIKFM